MADQPVAISDITDPGLIRIKLLASGRDGHVPMTAVVAASVHGAPTKTTPVDADEFGFWDSVALRAVKTTWAGIKATLVATANTWSAVQTFSAIPVLSGGGIAFPATQIPSAGANVLDDYEEGTIVPALTFGGAAVGMTYTRRDMWYTKNGNLVTGGFELLLSAKGSSVGVATLSIPFTSNASANQFSTGIVWFQAMTGLTGALQHLIPNGSAVMQLGQPGAVNVAQITDTSFTNTSRLAGSFAYHV